MNTARFTWLPYGECGALIELESLADVHALNRSVRASGLAAECVPGAQTLFVTAADSELGVSELVEQIRALPIDAQNAANQRVHTIHVVYDGVDLNDVADLVGCSADEIVQRHCAPTYTVAFLGFSRSFPYLVGLDPTIIVPRLASPRTSVPAGSVGMGAGFTGVYPASSPGGWRLLGHTNEQFFDETSDPPSTLAPGDLVRFRPVSS